MSVSQIRDLASLDDYAACVALQQQTWGGSFSEVVPGAILQVSQKLGGVAAGAFDDDGRLLGFVFGMTGLRNGKLVHWSDMLAVVPEMRGQHLGEQLKRYQRDKVVAIGVTEMLWTFDPLVARNAYFNITRLGAFPAEYVENMYGITGSALHGGMPTDRLIASWRFDGVARTPITDAASAPVANPMRGMVPASGPLPDAPLVRIQLPREFEELRAAGEDVPLAWRLAVRDTFQRAFAAEYQVVGFSRGDRETLPAYLLRRT